MWPWDCHKDFLTYRRLETCLKYVIWCEVWVKEVFRTRCALCLTGLKWVRMSTTLTRCSSCSVYSAAGRCRGKSPSPTPRLLPRECPTGWNKHEALNWTQHFLRAETFSCSSDLDFGFRSPKRQICVLLSKVFLLLLNVSLHSAHEEIAEVKRSGISSEQTYIQATYQWRRGLA